MFPVAEVMVLAAAEWGILTWLVTGSLGLAIVVFIVMKLMGK